MNKVQTRSHKSHSKFSGINYFDDITSAHSAWVQDKSIWKISFEEGEISHRFRPKTKSEVWNNVLNL